MNDKCEPSLGVVWREHRRFADKTFRRQTFWSWDVSPTHFGRFADTYNIVYMTFKAIHMLIAEVEQSSNGPPEYNRRRHDFRVAGRSPAAASRRHVNAVITTLRQELTRIKSKSGDMGCQESVVFEKNYERRDVVSTHVPFAALHAVMSTASSAVNVPGGYMRRA